MGFRKLLSKLILGDYFKESFFFFFFCISSFASFNLKWNTNCHSIQGKLLLKNFDEVLIFGNFGEFLPMETIEFFYSGRKGGESSI